ncbi:MAG: DUF6600 domain-containing protein [Lysobacterales bacterium]
MSMSTRLLAFAGSLLLALSASSTAQAAYADPPGRVARISDSRGEVSYSPAGADQWVNVGRNRPLIRGDRLWSDHRSRAELQVGSSAVRIGADTSLEILELNDRLAQMQMTQGTINLSVRRLYQGQTIEVATPTLAFVIDRAGRYRIDVDPDADQTTIVVWEGAGVAYGQSSNFPMRAGDAVRFYSADLRDYGMYALPQADGFDRYCLARDERLDHSTSLRYVDDDLVGYADLDEYGSWSESGSYGNVWYPTQVAANWAPYRDGHWVWQEPWGWTWVDDAPWGFAPSHYGRWASISGRWGWIPGPRRTRPVYAPALVAFVGGSNFGVSVSLGGSSRVGWFPLGPRDVYMPTYHASREYFTQVNVNNTVVNNTTITNVYNNYSSGNIDVAQVNYANRGLSSAVTAVPGDVFRSAKPVNAAMISLDRDQISAAQVMIGAPIAPSTQSVVGMATATRNKPTHQILERRVVARNAPPPQAKPFALREQQLGRNPGKVPEAASREGAAAANIRVLAVQGTATDARAAGSRRGGDKPNGKPGKPGQLQALDRDADRQSPAKPGGRGRDEDRNPVAAPVKPAKMPERGPQPQPMDAKPQPQQQPQPPPRDVKPMPQQKLPKDERAAEQQQREQAAQVEQTQRRADQQAKELQRQNAQREQQQREQAAQVEQAQRKADQQVKEQQRQNAQREQQQREQAAQAQQAQRKADQQAQEQQRQNARREQQQREQAVQVEQAQRKADQQAKEQQRQNAQREQQQLQQQAPKPSDRGQRQPGPAQQAEPAAKAPRKPKHDKDDDADEANSDGEHSKGKNKDGR